MLKFFEKNKKTISFHNGITNSSSPYEVAEKVWNLIDLDEVRNLSSGILCQHHCDLNMPDE